MEGKDLKMKIFCLGSFHEFLRGSKSGQLLVQVKVWICFLSKTSPTDLAVWKGVMHKGWKAFSSRFVIFSLLFLLIFDRGAKL